MADSRVRSFSETSYGIVKRLQTIEAWTAAVAQRLGKTSLSILDYGCGTGDHVTYPLACRGHQRAGGGLSRGFHRGGFPQVSPGESLVPDLGDRRAGWNRSDSSIWWSVPKCSSTFMSRCSF